MLAIVTMVGGLGSAVSRADPAAEIAAIHVEAMGGRVRIAALTAMRATGEVTAAGKAVRFTLFAARPDRVRVETSTGGRTLVQGSDGSAPAWEAETGTPTPSVRKMADGIARTFVADAEFDDPLVAGVAGGYGFDFGGEIMVAERKLFRVLVTQRLREPFTLLVDASTYLIVGRQETRETATGRRVPVVTRYGDFRPVEGVLLPHQVAVTVDGRVTQETQIDRIEANPNIEAAGFARP